MFAAPQNRSSMRTGYVQEGFLITAPEIAGRHVALPAGAIGIGSAKQQGSEWTEGICLGVLLGGLAWVPFFYGSNTLWAWGINAVLFPGLVVLYELSLLVRGRRHPVGVRTIALAATLFAAVVLWILFQTATWVPAWLAHPIWLMAADALDRPVHGSISVNRDLTELGLLRLITAASVFWLSLQLCRDGSRAFRLIGAIAAIGAAYALYGITALKTGHLPLLAIPSDGRLVSSTFVNRDSYATYAGLGLITGAGLMLHFYQDRISNWTGSVRHQLGALIEATGQRGAALLAGCFLVSVALLLTGSRGGVIAAVVGLMALGASMWRRRSNRAAASMIPLVFGVVIVTAIAFAFGDIVAGKIDESGFGDPNRAAVYLITWRSVLDRPLLGFGYGTFIDVFPMYRDRSISVAGIWGQAHNTYLELLQGLGLLFGSMLIGSVVLLALRCARGAARRQQHGVIPAIAAAAACLVGVHALVDFSLQMQAVALTFAAVLGAGVAESETSRLPLED